MFGTPPRLFHPAFPHSPEPASPLRSPRHARSPQSPHPHRPAPPPVSAAASLSPALASPIYPVVMATALIVLCLISAVLLSLINQQCNDVALFSPLGPSDDFHPLIPQPSSLASTASNGPADSQHSEKEESKEEDVKAKSKAAHTRKHQHHSEERTKDRHQHPHVETASAAATSSTAGAAASGAQGGAGEDCVGLCCMSFFSRMVLILAFFCNAVLISFLLCVHQQPVHGEPTAAAAAQPSVLSSLALPGMGSSPVHRCVSYLLLAVVHFLLTGCGGAPPWSTSSRTSATFPSFHSSLLFSSYILLLFTSFCIEALSLLSAITPPHCASPPLHSLSPSPSSRPTRTPSGCCSTPSPLTLCSRCPAPPSLTCPPTSSPASATSTAAAACRRRRTSSTCAKRWRRADGGSERGERGRSRSARRGALEKRGAQWRPQEEEWRRRPPPPSPQRQSSSSLPTAASEEAAVEEEEDDEDELRVPGGQR